MEPPSLAIPRGYELLGSIEVGDSLVVGGRFGEARIRSMPGTWIACVADADAVAPGDPAHCRFVAVHASRAGSLALLLASARPGGEVQIAERALVVADSSVSAATDLVDEAALEGLEGVFAGGRAARVVLEAAASGAVSVALDGSDAVMVAIDVRPSSSQGGF
jgi:hypothetical protein